MESAIFIGLSLFCLEALEDAVIRHTHCGGSAGYPSPKRGRTLILERQLAGGFLWPTQQRSRLGYEKEDREFQEAVMCLSSEVARDIWFEVVFRQLNFCIIVELSFLVFIDMKNNQISRGYSSWGRFGLGNVFTLLDASQKQT